MSDNGVTVALLEPHPKCVCVYVCVCVCVCVYSVGVWPVCVILQWFSRSPFPGTMLTTPLGKPARAVSSANLRAVRGVTSAGFRTTVLPGNRDKIST